MSDLFIIGMFVLLLDRIISQKERSRWNLVFIPLAWILSQIAVGVILGFATKWDIFHFPSQHEILNILMGIAPPLISASLVCVVFWLLPSRRKREV